MLRGGGVGGQTRPSRAHRALRLRGEGSHTVLGYRAVHFLLVTTLLEEKSRW